MLVRRTTVVGKYWSWQIVVLLVVVARAAIVTSIRIFTSIPYTVRASRSNSNVIIRAHDDSN